MFARCFCLNALVVSGLQAEFVIVTRQELHLLRRIPGEIDSKGNAVNVSPHRVPWLYGASVISEMHSE